MKKFLLFLAISLTFFASCQTPQKKAEKFAEKYVKSILYIPKSYEHISTKVDTAYNSPAWNPAILAIADKIVKAENDIKSHESSMRSAKSSMSIWENPYGAFARNEYEEAKREYETALAEFNASKAEVQANTEELIKSIQSLPMDSVIGWMIQTRYRAETNSGNKVINDAIIIASKDFSEVLFAIDPDDESFNAQINKIAEIFGAKL